MESNHSLLREAGIQSLLHTTASYSPKKNVCSWFCSIVQVYNDVQFIKPNNRLVEGFME